MTKRLAALLLLLAALLVACSPSATLAVPTETPLPAITPTPEATPTPTQPPGKAIVIRDAAQPDLSANAQALVAELAEPAGLTVEAVDSLAPEALAGEVRLVVGLALLPNLAELTGAAPQAQFVIVSPAPLDATGNLTVIQTNPDHQAFIAGYTATLLSNDWRAAGLIPAEQPSRQNAFVNGGGYFCGTCSPGWPLGVTFPLVAGAATPADGAAWQAVAAGFFDTGKAEAFYIAAEAARPEVFAYLAGLTQLNTPVRLVGALPPPPELSAQWAATVSLDPLEALRQALPEALAGRSAGVLNVPVTLKDVNPGLLSPGRQEKIEAIIAELSAGIIYPLSIPIE